MKAKLKVLDLFSGIGGFSLGLERTGGFETVAFCEIEEFPRKVLAKHWPDVPCHKDVRVLNGKEVGPIDVICGGFPCQDISLAGRGAGLTGERSGLWSEFHRLIDEVGPRWAIIENVPALRSRGLSTVLQNLCSIGYDAEWHCIPASYVCAPHRRDRIWIIAYPNKERGEARAERPGRKTRPDTCRRSAKPGMANTTGGNDGVCSAGTSERQKQEFGKSGGRNVVADANRYNEHGRRSVIQMGRERLEAEAQKNGNTGRTEWSPEPSVGRVAYGVPQRVDRLKGLGNAVVPQIPEMIGYAILEAAE